MLDLVLRIRLIRVNLNCLIGICLNFQLGRDGEGRPGWGWFGCVFEDGQCHVGGGQVGLGRQSRLMRGGCGGRGGAGRRSCRALEVLLVDWLHGAHRQLVGLVAFCVDDVGAGVVVAADAILDLDLAAQIVVGMNDEAEDKFERTRQVIMAPGAFLHFAVNERSAAADAGILQLNAICLHI